MDKSNNWIRGAVVTMAFAAAGTVQADEIWGPATSIPAGGYVTVGNTWGSQATYAHNILTSSQEVSLAAFLAANPLDQAGVLSLYFADDDGYAYNWYGGGGSETSNLEYFQYSLNGGDWIGGISSSFEVDGSICYTGTMSLATAACKTGYWSFDISLDGAALSSLLAAPGLPKISIRVNPDYEYVYGYTTTTSYDYTDATYDSRKGKWKCPNGGELTTKNGKKVCKVTITTKTPRYKDYDQDFYFKGSILTAWGNPEPPQVPEPATLGLLGLGMLGVGLARRRRGA